MEKNLAFVAAIIIADFIGSINGNRESNFLSAYIEINKGLYLFAADKVLRSYLTLSSDLCGLNCLKEASCLSFNAAVKKSDNGMILCEMLATNKNENSKLLQPSKNFHHYSVLVSIYKRSIYICMEHKVQIQRKPANGIVIFFNYNSFLAFYSFSYLFRKC